ncbi:MAG: ABC transporter substrate-binding protein [Deltaproteobacteria bacterium]|nr:ABC transporter substrate-binding protein [Deltaproteobacteria bacterium]
MRLLCLASTLAVACSPAARPARLEGSPPAPVALGDAAVPDAPPPTIAIGAYLPMTGASGVFGNSVHQGIDLAFKERNATGGIHGRPLDLRTLDTMGTPEAAADAALRLIKRDDVVALLGEFSSGLSMAGGAVAQHAGVPMISPSATSSQVNAIGDRVFRVYPSDVAQASAIARFAFQQGTKRRIAVLADLSTPYARTLTDAFVAELAHQGQATVTVFTYAARDTSHARQLAAIQKAKADVLFLPGYYSDVAAIAVEARALGVTATFLGTDGWESARLIELGGAAVEGARFSTGLALDDPRPETARFVAAYRATYGADPDTLAATGYDAALLLLDALDRSASTDGADLAAAIASVRGLTGAGGTITIGADREPARPFTIVTVRGGEFHYLATIAP